MERSERHGSQRKTLGALGLGILVLVSLAIWLSSEEEPPQLPQPEAESANVVENPIQTTLEDPSPGLERRGNESLARAVLSAYGRILR